MKEIVVSNENYKRMVKMTIPPEIAHSLQGCIFSQEQADAIIEMVRQRIR